MCHINISQSPHKLVEHRVRRIDNTTPRVLFHRSKSLLGLFLHPTVLTLLSTSPLAFINYDPLPHFPLLTPYLSLSVGVH